MANISPRAKRMLKNEVIRVVSKTHRHRYFVRDFTLGANGTTNFLLLAADDDPDYEVGGDGSTLCECPPKSKIIDVDLNMMIDGVSTDFGWILLRVIENALPAANVNFATLFSNNRTADSLFLRQNVMAAGFLKTSAQKDIGRIHTRIRRKALSRAGNLNDLDRLVLAVTNFHGSTNGAMDLWGTITTRAH